MSLTNVLAWMFPVLITAVAACGDDQRHVSEQMCFLPADLTSNRDLEACPDAWDDETMDHAERMLDEDAALQNIAGPEPDIVDYEGQPWLMSCCYTVYSAGDTSWPLL